MSTVFSRVGYFTGNWHFSAMAQGEGVSQNDNIAPQQTVNGGG